MDNLLEVRHLMNRAGFGCSIQELRHLEKLNRKFAVKLLFKDSQKYDPISLVGKELMPHWLMPEKPPKDKAKILQEQSRKKVKEINTTWVKRMAMGKSVLRERMTLFWHGHFACVSGNAYFVQVQNNTLRKHALGKFRDLLLAVSKDPAMLLFLNNHQNKKKSPNENYARELLELFSIGHGHYSEPDIKNAARAFTGWGLGKSGGFHFNERQHDFGEKTFMGKKGDFNGADIVDIILASPKTAKFITEKIYRYFVNEQGGEDVISKLSQQFYDSGYDIELLMEQIFLSDWFYDEKNVGTKIKSPVELIVGLIKQLNGEFVKEDSILFLENNLGQILFFPPNVGGWPSGKAWIDSSSLAFRMVIPAVLASSGKSGYQAKKEGDANAPEIGKGMAEKLKMSIDWKGLKHYLSLEKKGKKELDRFALFFLGRETSAANIDMIANSLSSYKSAEVAFRKRCIAYMSLPEYQLC